ncbi:MAG: type I 3-dehydroquinate dehydratase, partial [Planctomycetota bacterium]|jgi:3-dehydroquinate dehydratase/shikimate dehydrogenase
VTNRPVREGGACDGPELPRLAVLRRAAELGADYVDVELDVVAQLGELPGRTARIVSRHDCEGTPADLEGAFRRIRDAGPDVAKLVVTAPDLADVLPVLALLESHAAKLPLIALSMGEEGLVSRLLAGKLGAFMTYASRAEGRESAPGQVPVEEMLGMYRFPNIGAGTSVYGVVANPVAHSMSPAVHNAAFAASGMDAVYLPFKVTDLNTDVEAAIGAIEDAVSRAGMAPLTTCNVLLVGAGGAARAIAYGLRRKGVPLTIANRTVERAQKLAAEVGAHACGLGAMEEVSADVVINGTSVGMWPQVDESPVPTGMLREGMVVFDSVYNPIRTRLLAEAERAGAVTASGLDWFVNQAAAQFELWTGEQAPCQVMEEAIRRHLPGP